MANVCHFLKGDGTRCNAPPLREGDFCLWHSPEHAAEVAEGRRLGGLRRRREVALSGAYEFDGLATSAHLRRVLDIATLDALALENSIARVRALTSIVQVGARLLEVAELQARIETLEATLQPRIAAARRR